MFSKLAMHALGFCLVVFLGPVAADTPSPYPDFTARWVKPPESGTRKRITVQIQPAETSDAKATSQTPPDPGGAGREGSPGNYPWFWAAVSPDLSQAGSGRLDSALSALRGNQPVTVPRLQTFLDIIAARGVSILRETVGTRVSPALVLAVIAVESGGQVDAVSASGASGLMQLMPDTATRFGVADRLEPDENIAGGVKYLDWLLKKFGGDPILALAGYNAGEGAVRDYAGVPPLAETRDYVPKVLAAFEVARRLCATPPELISDGCVFTSAH